MNPLGNSGYSFYPKNVSSKNNPAEIEKNKIKKEKKQENKKVIKEFKDSALALRNKYSWGSLPFQGHKTDLLKAVGEKYKNAIRTISKNEEFCDKDTTNKNLKEITKEIERICFLSPQIRNSRFNIRKFMIHIATCNDRLIKDKSITNKGATAEFFFDEDDNYNTGIFKKCSEKLDDYIEDINQAAQKSERYWEQQRLLSKERDANRDALYDRLNKAAYKAKQASDDPNSIY